MLSSLGWVMRKLMLIERREVCLWHEANMETVLENVCFKTAKQTLMTQTSMSANDP
jgi:hypothetical protein